MTNEWTNAEHVHSYLARLEDIPHRAEGEATLLSELPSNVRNVLDLGCGNGHLLGLVLARHPAANGVGLDFSPAMLKEVRQRFQDDTRVEIVEHNLDRPLPDLGRFDVIVSSFAIHHCEDARKRSLYKEVYEALEPGGTFCNLEHVSSPTPRLHEKFMAALEMTAEDEDPSNKLLDVETQLGWLREIGFVDVDCHWKWRELALLSGEKPPASEVGDVQQVSVATAAETRLIDEQLEAFNAAQVGRDDFTPLNLVVRDECGSVVGGLKAVTGWDWLYVQILWVAENQRGSGVGSRLLEHAERAAAQAGCVGSCLSTFTFQAPEFYRRRGYEVFGQIDQYPSDQTMFFMSKRFAPHPEV